jgi:hypothetical protein
LAGGNHHQRAGQSFRRRVRGPGHGQVADSGRADRKPHQQLRLPWRDDTVCPDERRILASLRGGVAKCQVAAGLCTFFFPVKPACVLTETEGVT